MELGKIQVVCNAWANISQPDTSTLHSKICEVFLNHFRKKKRGSYMPSNSEAYVLILTGYATGFFFKLTHDSCMYVYVNLELSIREKHYPMKL